MRIWVVAVGEPLPTDRGRPRLLRVGLLAGLLRRRGHEVVWWTSGFDHQTKTRRAALPANTPELLGYELRLLHGCGYARNVGLARIRDQRQVARAFELEAQTAAAPDVILASYPTIELCQAVVDYGRAHGVPVVLDARDMWPDIFANLAPGPLQGLARWALGPMFRASGRAFAGATAIIGITDAFVDWACERADRKRRSADRAFPLAYELGLVDEDELVVARDGWTRLGVQPGGTTVCFFGTLGRQFDIPTVLKAAMLLKDEDIRFVICGTGDRLTEFQRLAAGAHNVLFPGWVGAAAVRALMERSMAGLAPYFNERSFTLSIPNKAIEYLAGGLPILSCLTGELQALIGRYDCGLHWAEGDAQALSAAIMALAQGDRRRRQMADNAMFAYSESFVAEAVYGRLTDHLCDLARPGSC